MTTITLIENGTVTVRDLTEQELAAMAARAAPSPEQVQATNAANAKYVGVEFEGVMCSATGQDQNGLVAVLLSIQLQGAAFPATRFWFDNGNSLVITTANYEAFMAVWLPFRQSFFLAEGGS
jgi:hypothetical protein